VPESPTATSVAVVPSTRGWLPPTNRLMVPSSAGICVVCTYWLISRMTCRAGPAGRWGLPVACGACNLLVERGHLLGQAVDGVGAVLQLLGTVYWISSMRSAEVRKRDAVSSMREHQGARRQVGGRATTSENAFIMSLMAAPNPGPPRKFLHLAEPLRAHRIPALTEAAAAAWR
jgi:hypothetical protein